jgi:AcrR family transcriptional regulator
MSGLRESKKRETRQRISDIATTLFLARGFDVVTVDEIAAAARVSKVTVFNYFARKEDLFFDRGSENLEIVRQALAQRKPGVSVVRALEQLVHRLVKEIHPLVAFDTGTKEFWRTAKESAALRARARELRAEFERGLTEMLQKSAGRRDASAPLVAAMLTAAWCAAFANALRRRRDGATAVASRQEFLTSIGLAFDILRRGIRGSKLVRAAR